MKNLSILIGRAGKDPEVRTTQNSKVASFSLATTEKYKDKEETQWHQIIIWGKLADVVEKYVKKGMLLAVEGKVIYRTYDDKDGNKKYITEIVCHSMTMLSGKEPIHQTESFDAGPSEPQYQKQPETREDILNAPDEPFNDMPF
jgi:single-strand DNA-binding protein